MHFFNEKNSHTGSENHILELINFKLMLINSESRADTLGVRDAITVRFASVGPQSDF